MEINENDVKLLATYIKTNFGINLDKKATLIKSRLSSALEGKNVKSFGEYVNYAINDKSGKEISFLLTKLTTNYTYFMREEQHFHYLASKILPELEKTVTNKDLRIWSAACSSGEEPYTIAMVIDDYFGARKAGWDSKILATDISQKALSEAVAAVYPADRLTKLNAAWKTKYFNKIDDETYKLKDNIKNEVIFRTFNLMEQNFPFKKKFHVIFCRNVMIYFEKETKLALMNRFYDSLERGGHLIIGLSEPMGQIDNRFKSATLAIYRKE